MSLFLNHISLLHLIRLKYFRFKCSQGLMTPSLHLKCTVVRPNESWTEKEQWILRDLGPVISFPSVFLKMIHPGPITLSRTSDSTVTHLVETVR